MDKWEHKVIITIFTTDFTSGGHFDFGIEQGCELNCNQNLIENVFQITVLA